MNEPVIFSMISLYYVCSVLLSKFVSNGLIAQKELESTCNDF